MICTKFFKRQRYILLLSIIHTMIAVLKCQHGNPTLWISMLLRGITNCRCACVVGYESIVRAYDDDSLVGGVYYWLLDIIVVFVLFWSFCLLSSLYGRTSLVVEHSTQSGQSHLESRPVIPIQYKVFFLRRLLRKRNGEDDDDDDVDDKESHK